ncbi:MAG: DUF2889 domain-containing protein [Thermoplasmata archaeon]
MEILERNINIQTKKLKNGNILVKSSILDLHHSMCFEMEIDINTRQIESVCADMIKAPYPECKNALFNIQKIVGLRLERGLAKRMAVILGKNSGCTHMLEIAITAARTASYTILNILAEGKKWKDIMATDEERYEIVRSYLDNSCIVFKR